MLWLIGIIVVIILISVFLAFSAKSEPDPPQNREVYMIAVKESGSTVDNMIKVYGGAQATLADLKEAHIYGFRMPIAAVAKDGKYYTIMDDGVAETVPNDGGDLFYMVGVKPSADIAKTLGGTAGQVIPFLRLANGDYIWSKYDKQGVKLL